jgi:hypothetical protein
VAAARGARPLPRPLTSGGPRAQVWTCVDLNLRPFDCGRQAPPPPPPGLGAGGQAGGAGGYPPSNNACGLKIKIPPLDARYSGGGGMDWDTWAALGGVVAFGALLVLRRAGAASAGAAEGGAPQARPRRAGAAGGGRRGGAPAAQQPLLSA